MDNVSSTQTTYSLTQQTQSQAQPNNGSRNSTTAVNSVGRSVQANTGDHVLSADQRLKCKKALDKILSV